jgi:uncharacterized protein (TIGR02117 family)
MVRLFAACLLPAVLISACAPPVAIPATGDSAIYVIRRDWHTDIGLPVDEIAGPLASVETSFPGVRYLTFGFGERQFFLNGEYHFGAMLGALFPSRSALLMTALSATPEQAFQANNVVVLHVSRASLDRIEAALWNELEKSSAGTPVMLANGPYPGSVYYAANSTYSGLYTCNTWTADMLRIGGLPMPSAGILFAGQIMGPASWIGMHQTGGGRSGQANSDHEVAPP